MVKTENTIFYSIESTIKAYRKLAQGEIKKVNSKLTLDQSMVLKKLIEEPDITQMELSNLIFKDYASVTRMIELLVKNGFITREVDPANRRRNKISVTEATRKMMDKITIAVKSNRKLALNNILQKDLEQCRITLENIKKNIKNEL